MAETRAPQSDNMAKTAKPNDNTTTENPKPQPGLKKAITNMEKILDCYEKGSMIRDGWEEVKEELLQLLMETRDKVNVTTQQARLILERKQHEAPSYAQAARLRNPIVKPMTARANRELTLKCRDLTEEQSKRSPLELVNELNNEASKALDIKEGITAVRKLPSGDLIITAQSEQIRDKLENTREWYLITCPGAKINRKRYTVIARGVPMGHMGASPQEVKADICRTNKQWAAESQIIEAK